MVHFPALLLEPEPGSIPLLLLLPCDPAELLAIVPVLLEIIAVLLEVVPALLAGGIGVDGILGLQLTMASVNNPPNKNHG